MAKVKEKKADKNDRRKELSMAYYSNVKLDVEKFEFRETDQKLTHFCLGGDVCAILFRDGEYIAVTESPNLPFTELSARGDKEILELLKVSCPRKKVIRRFAFALAKEKSRSDNG